MSKLRPTDPLLALPPPCWHRCQQGLPKGVAGYWDDTGLMVTIQKARSVPDEAEWTIVGIGRAGKNGPWPLSTATFRYVQKIFGGPRTAFHVVERDEAGRNER